MFSTKKPVWENPEKSAGSKSHRRIGGQNCYEAIGPAYEVFLEIGPRIKELLDAYNDELGCGEQMQHSIAFYMFMIGSELAKSQPTLIFASRSKRQRTMAQALVKENIESGYLVGVPMIWQFGWAIWTLCDKGSH